MVAEKGQRFTLRDGSITLGTGVITKIFKNLTEQEREIVVEGKKAQLAMEKKSKERQKN